jgi:hypothetical protein
LIFHLYHCNLARFRDYKTAPGRNRPDGTGRFPERPGEADFDYTPPTTSFGDPSLGKLLELFQSIDLVQQENSPVRINWKYLEKQIGLTREDLRDLFRKASALRLMRGLTIDYDHECWLRHSSEKGCFVIMTCVEASDLERDRNDCVNAYCDAVDEIRDAVLNKGHTMQHVFVVPNGHLAPRAGNGLPWKDALEVLLDLPPALEKRGYEAALNSYGYTKLIELGINAHKLGYVLRVV